MSGAVEARVEVHPRPANPLERTASGPLTDLALTLPIFIAYHLGVVLLPMRNAADWVTRSLIDLADRSLVYYSALTVAIGAIYVGILLIAGRGKTMRWQAFTWLIAESGGYAFAMQSLASYAVGRLSLVGTDAVLTEVSPFAGLILSLGAGFYEEVAFRVLLFGLGFKALTVLFPLHGFKRLAVWLAWGVGTSLFFSLWHYLGPLADPLDLRTFVFRAVCGLVFIVIYQLRGFAPAVWTHALYDIWVLVF